MWPWAFSGFLLRAHGCSSIPNLSDMAPDQNLQRAGDYSLKTTRGPLTSREHRSVAQEVTHLLSEALETAKPLSILELKRLGKEHWQELDAGRHIKNERASWD